MSSRIPGIRRRIPAVPTVLLIAGLALLAAPDEGWSQALLGQALQEGSGNPVEGALVIVTDSRGEQVARGLTDAAGRFRLVLPGPDTYGLTLERIGFETVVGGPYQVEGTGTLRLELTVPETAIELEGISVEADRRCVVRPGEGEATARLWDEARKALSATELTAQEEYYRFELFTYSRSLDPEDLRIRDETRARRTGVSDSPIRSLPAEDLSRAGYIRELDGGVVDYYGPDARVLLSDRFLSDHCWSVAFPRRGENAGHIGLAFEPVSDELPEVEGVLWLEQETARLSHLEYSYTRLPYDVRDARLGGRVEFEGLPNGTWIVRRWYIRMPQLGRRVNAIENVTTEIVLAGIREEGAEISRIESLAGASVTDEIRGGGVEGAVFDSLAGTPLVGAQVIVSGTQFSGVTDERGTFLLEGIPEGRYTMAVTHPRLSLLRIPPPFTSVDVVEGTVLELRMGVPSLGTLEARLCTETEEERAQWPREASALSGSVREDVSGAPMAGVRVRILWSSFSRAGRGYAQRNDGFEVSLDAAGTFRLCGLPPQERLAIQVLPPGDDDQPILETAVVLSERSWGGVEIRVGEGEGSVALSGGVMGALDSDATLRRAEELAEQVGRNPGAEGREVNREEEAEEFQRARTMEDLLRTVSGIRVMGNAMSLCVEPTRGRVNTGNECAWPMVIVDGVVVSDPQGFMLSLEPWEVASVEYVTPANAGARYGTGSQNGVILIRTR